MALPQQSTISIALQQSNQTNRSGFIRNGVSSLVAIDDCLVQEQDTQKVINGIVQLLNKYQIPIYDERKNSGILRTLMVRIGIATGEVQVVFITNSVKLPQKMR